MRVLSLDREGTLEEGMATHSTALVEGFLTREESGVLGFPSRRGLTPRGSLECNPEIPAFPGDLIEVSSGGGLLQMAHPCDRSVQPFATRNWPEVAGARPLHAVPYERVSNLGVVLGMPVTPLHGVAVRMK